MDNNDQRIKNEYIHKILMDRAEKFYHSINENKASQFIGIWTILCLIIFWFYFIDKYAVNILFWDHWDLYDPFFRHADFVDIFTKQHGPHRQGIGFILTYFIDTLSHWNTRIICFTIWLIFLTIAFGYYKITSSLFKHPSFKFFDLIIFLIALNPVQIILTTPNISHGPMPALLVMLFCFVLLIKNFYVRNATLLIINFNAIYSGFGIFLGAITPILFIYEAICFYKVKDNNKFYVSLFCLITSLFFIYLFFIDYHWQTSNPNFQFPYPRPWEYIYFVVLSYAGFLGIPGHAFLSYFIGFIIFGTLCYMVIKQSIFLFKSTRKNIDEKQLIINKIILILTTFSLLFIFSTAVGRIQFGIVSGQSTRYMIYLAPSIIAIYLHIKSSSNRYKSIIIIMMLFTLVLLELFGNNSLEVTIQFSGKKQEWKNNYLQFEKIEMANQLSSFKIHPNEKSTDMKNKLQYLKENKLNLFKEYSTIKAFKPKLSK
jgi:hypothetical protein